jgi:hypothetical protein
MRISLSDSRANGFKKWSNAHQAIADWKRRNDDECAEGNAIVTGDQDLNPPMMTLPSARTALIQVAASSTSIIPAAIDASSTTATSP